MVYKIRLTIGVEESTLWAEIYVLKGFFRRNIYCLCDHDDAQTSKQSISKRIHNLAYRHLNLYSN